MAGEFQAGSVVGKLTLDRKQWNAAIKGVKTQTKSMGNWVKQNSAQFKKLGLAITAVGAVAAVTFTKMVKKYMETGDWIDKMSKRTGISATTLSELAYAADITGANLDLLEKGVRRMSRTIVEAGEGLESYLRAFRLIGLELKDLQGLNPEEQFLKIGKAIGKLSDETEKAAVAQMIFGRAGTMLIPLFKEGEEGMEKLREEAHRLGIVFDAEGAARAAEFKDSMTGLKGAFQGLGFAIVKDIIPILTRMAKHFTDVFVNVRDNTQTFAEGILGFFKILAQGIEGLMLAWSGFKALVFKIAEYAGKVMKAQIDIMTAPLKLLEKIPGKIGEPARLMLKQIGNLTGTLTTITDGYNKAADDEVNKMANLIEKYDAFVNMLKNATDELKNFTAESIATSETIVATSLPAARDLWGELMKLGDTTEDVTESSGDNMKKMQEDQVAALETWAAALQGGLAGVMSAIKQIVIGEFLKSLATSKLPFLAKLALTAVTVGIVEAAFAGFMKGAQGRALGGSVKEGDPYTVGERGRELFVPERSGVIVPNRELPLTQPTVSQPISFTIIVPDQLDPYSAQRITRNQVIPQILDALRSKQYVTEFREELGVK